MSFIVQKVATSTLLKLQLLYCGLGFGYNLVSYLKAASGNQPLASTNPVTGGIFMLFYGLCLLPGFKGLEKLYRVLMGLFVVTIGYSGIIKHFLVYAQQPEAYSSKAAWVSAIGINLFGAVLNVMAAAGRFERDSDNR